MGEQSAMARAARGAGAPDAQDPARPTTRRATGKETRGEALAHLDHRLVR